MKPSGQDSKPLQPPGYYTRKLAAERLELCYAVASPRVRQYLQAEIDYVLEHVHPTDSVLELGCGYGRVLEPIAARARFVVGIDTAGESLSFGRARFPTCSNLHFAAMNALDLGFASGAFDVTLCVQNGLSAFKVDRLRLMREMIRVTKPGGWAIFSTYAERFWDHRLEWFAAQAAHGLIGEIDHTRTGDGVIVCKDGFRVTTISPAEFRDRCAQLGIEPELHEADESILFCKLRVP